MLDMSAVGREYDPYVFTVERCKIKELCLAIGDNNPLFFDKDHAVKEGYKDTPASLTFATVLNFWGYPEIWSKMKEIGVDVKKLLHASEEYEYFEPIYPGDVITGKVGVESMRDSESMDIVSFKTTYTKENRTAMVAYMKIVVIKGVK